MKLTIKNAYPILILFFIHIYKTTAQNIINPYRTDYPFVIGQNDPTNPDVPQYINLVNGVSTTVYDAHNNYAFSSSNLYTGEYIIFFKGGIPTPPNWHNSLQSQALTYKIEAASFPFTLNCFDNPPYCGYDPNLNPNAPRFSRSLKMPDDNYVPVDNAWLYLKNVVEGGFAENGSLRISGLSPTDRCALVSTFFHIADVNPFINDRHYLPHTALKHTVYIHCNSSVFSEVIDSIQWVYDLTRGRTRNYPFINSNDAGAGGAYSWDLAYYPEVIPKPDDPNTNGTSNDFHRYDQSSNTDWIVGGTINYFDFVSSSGRCSGSSAYLPFADTDPFYEGDLRIFDAGRPAPYALYNTFLRSSTGSALVGYNEYRSNFLPNNYKMYIPADGVGIEHSYFLNHNFDLSIINPSEKIIYNPSEVTLVADNGTDPVNIIFPRDFTFKTILGRYPSVQEVEDASNDPQNDGSFNNLREVPVPVNASDGHAADPVNYPPVMWDDPTTSDPNNFLNDERFGYYYIDNNATLTVEQCVKIFDARFEVRDGGTLKFDDHTQILGHEDKDNNIGRYKIRGEGGAVLRNYDAIQYVQNGNITQTTPLNYIATDAIEAGTAVDPDTDQPDGIYEVHSGADVAFVAENYIHLTSGFYVSGGDFHAAIDPNLMTPVQCPASLQGGGNRFAYTPPTHHTPQPTLLLSPNPSTGKFNLYNTAHKFSACILTVSDVMGNIIYSAQSESTPALTVDLSAKPKGIYFVKLEESEKVSISKIIIQ